MGRKKDISESQKGAIQVLRDEGFSQKYIAEKIGLNQSTVSRFLKNKESVRKNCGRKRKSTKRDDKRLKRLCLSNRCYSSKELCREWEESTGVNVDPSTVRKRLISMGLRSRRMVKKPLLTSKQRAKRVQWCKRHKLWTVDQWKNVFFSDECKMEITYHSGNVRVRRYSHEAEKPWCQLPTVKFPASLMLWSGFSAKAIGYLHVCERTINSEEYIKILRTRVLPYQQRFFNAGDMTFQDDSAPAHRSKVVDSFKNTHGIKSLPWPGNSPDLNPVENLWKILKAKVSQHRPRTKNEMIAAIIRVWTGENSEATLVRLAESMPRRIACVLKRRGGATKY